MIASIVLAGIGIVLSGLAVLLFGVKLGSPERHWFVGMGAMVPAWLVGFLVFLTGLAAAEKGVRIYLAASSAAALLGVIGTEYGVRYLKSRSSVVHPAVFWLLGLIALVPSWLVLLRGIVAR